MKMTILHRKALASIALAAALAGAPAPALAGEPAPSDDGVWFGGADAFYEDFTPEAVERNEKEQAKAEERAKRNAEKAKKQREEDIRAAARRDKEAEERRQKNEARDARRAAKAQSRDSKAASKQDVDSGKKKRAKGEPGQLEPADLVYRGVTLGDGVDNMRKQLGEPDFDRQSRVHGITVRYYIYGRKLQVGVFEPEGAPPRVVDIVIRDESYKGRNNVRYGSTFYHVFETFGRSLRQPIDGKLYHVFEAAGPGHKRLLLEYQPPENIVVAWRITSLPLSEAEAERRYDEYAPAAVAADVGALMIRQKTIDTSEINISGGLPQINIAID